MRKLSWFVLIGVLAAGGGWLLHQRGLVAFPFLKAPESVQAQRRGGPMREERIPVLVTPLRRDTLPVILESVGTAQASATVVVKPQADGRLIEVAFREGQQVKKGDVLARIDPVTYQAQFDQAVAKKAQNEALLANAQRDLERYASLAKGAFGSQQQADTQKTLVAQLSAQLRLDQAAIDQAKAVLDYTIIRAPLDGRTGIRAVDEGNIVRASDAAGLVTIAQMSPMMVLFSLPQQQLREVKAAQLRGPVPVSAIGGDGKTVLGEGTVSVIDNQIDPTTGTVKVKAEFANQDMALWAGQFVNVRIETDRLNDVLVVPSAAVQRGPEGPYVYLFEGGKAVLKPVSIGRQTAMVAVVESGIAMPADIITTGFSRLDDGVKVELARGGQAEAAQKPLSAKSP